MYESWLAIGFSLGEGDDGKLKRGTTHCHGGVCLTLDELQMTLTMHLRSFTEVFRKEITPEFILGQANLAEGQYLIGPESRAVRLQLPFWRSGLGSNTREAC